MDEDRLTVDRAGTRLLALLVHGLQILHRDVAMIEHATGERGGVKRLVDAEQRAVAEATTVLLVDIAWKRKAVCFFHGKTQFRVGRDARFVLLKDLYMS